MIADFNKNISSYECQLSSTIQRTSRMIESGKRKTNRSRRS